MKSQSSPEALQALKEGAANESPYFQKELAKLLETLKRPGYPLGAFCQFSLERRASLKSEEPDLPLKKIYKRIKREWRELKDKRAYKELARKDYEDYIKLLHIWEDLSGEVPARRRRDTVRTLKRNAPAGKSDSSPMEPTESPSDEMELPVQTEPMTPVEPKDEQLSPDEKVSTEENILEARKQSRQSSSKLIVSISLNSESGGTALQNQEGEDAQEEMGNTEPVANGSRPLEEELPKSDLQDIGCLPENPQFLPPADIVVEGEISAEGEKEDQVPIEDNESHKIVKGESLLGGPERMEFSLLDFQEQDEARCELVSKSGLAEALLQCFEQNDESLNAGRSNKQFLKVEGSFFQQLRSPPVGKFLQIRSPPVGKLLQVRSPPVGKIGLPTRSPPVGIVGKVLQARPAPLQLNNGQSLFNLIDELDEGQLFSGHKRQRTIPEC